jgi:hypothetical protein
MIAEETTQAMFLISPKASWIVERLDAAHRCGEWDAEHGHLRERESFDGALRLVISGAP